MNRNDMFLKAVDLALRQRLKPDYTGNLLINIRKGVGEMKIKENKSQDLVQLLREDGAI